MAHNIDTMAYYGEKPWHKLGRELNRRATPAEMLVAAGMDWEVKMRPAYGTKVEKNNRALRYELVRLPRPRTNEKEIMLGLVSHRYEPLQNRDALDFFNYVAHEGKAWLETAGSLREGEQIWALARMPGEMLIGGKDECHKYLLLSNSHTGKGSITIQFTAVRVVCQNTLMLAHRDGNNKHLVRHSKMMHFRLKEIAEFMHKVYRLYEETEQFFQAMIRRTMSSDDIQTFAETLYQTDQRRLDFLEVLESAKDLRQQGIRGTLWAAYNAVTALEDHRRGKTEITDEGRLNRAWYGVAAGNKYKALEVARTFIPNGNKSLLIG